jgi:hypothetical protein
VIEQDDGSFLLVGEDGVFEFPETSTGGNSDD